MRNRKNDVILKTKEIPKNPNSSDLETKKKSSNSTTLSPNRVLLFCLAFRILNSLLVQTYFNPDEHWQALEVAHRITFGYGHLTWEWKKGIRSYLHPMMFVFLYKVLAFLHLDIPWFMMRAPRLLQSVVSAYGDLYLYKFSHELFGYNVAFWALFAQLTNWFIFYCITRTLSNNLETVLTIIGLYYWPCMRSVYSRKYPLLSRKWGLFAAALACAIRPTSAIVWIYVGFLELFLARDKIKFIFLEVVPIGVFVLGLTCLLDRIMYGSWVLVPLNFLKFNFLSSGGDYYGTHYWHWYFTQGFTVMLFTFLPFSLAGIYISKQFKLSGLIFWVLGLYSVLGHKEFRFVLPVLPIAMIFAGCSLASIYGEDLTNATKTKCVASKCPSKMKLFIFFLLVTNIPMALYMSMVHQRGSEDVMNYLAKETLTGKVKSVLFLMPCHSTPYYSILHQHIPMRFLDCSPSEMKGTPDESDRFLMNPVEFASEFVKNWSQPTHIVLFDSHEKFLQNFLALHYFQEEKRFFHAHFKVDRDLQSSIVVYALNQF